MSGWDRRLFLLQGGALALAGCGGGSQSSSPPAATPVCLKLLVPAYFYKTNPAWTQLATTKQPLVVIANANNGPGTALDVGYQSVVNEIRAAGHRVKGYVYTQYGKRDPAVVLADMDAWSRLYGVNDFFIDEVSAVTQDLAYYRDLLAAATAKNSSRKYMLNPGMTPVVGYFGLSPDVEVLVFENPWSSYDASRLPAWLDTVASQCWIMALSASEAQLKEVAAVARARRFAGFFATNVPFESRLPAYWDSQAKFAVCA